MKAAVLVEEGRVEVEEVETPAADGWALVSARAAGVCGTELHFLEGMIPPPHERFVLGHESAGSAVMSVTCRAAGTCGWPSTQEETELIDGHSSRGAASRGSTSSHSPTIAASAPSRESAAAVSGSA